MQNTENLKTSSMNPKEKSFINDNESPLILTIKKSRHNNPNFSPENVTFNQKDELVAKALKELYYLSYLDKSMEYLAKIVKLEIASKEWSFEDKIEDRIKIAYEFYSKIASANLASTVGSRMARRMAQIYLKKLIKVVAFKEKPKYILDFLIL